MNPATARETEKADPDDRRVQSIELGVFLFLILGAIASSYLLAAGESRLRFGSVAIASILNDLGLLGLVLYFVWRNGEGLHEIGWTRRQWGREVAWGAVLFPPTTGVVNLLEHALHTAGLSAPTRLPSFLSASGPGGVVLALVLVTVVAVVEETVFRGYLILRLKTATGRLGVAVVSSSVIFALGHGYEGTAGMISVFLIGVVLAVVYLWRGSLVAPIVMHFLVDFTGIVLGAVVRMRGS